MGAVNGYRNFYIPDAEQLGAEPLDVMLAPSNIPLRYRGLVSQFFVYGCSFLPLAAGATDSRPINIQADSDFAAVASALLVTSTDHVNVLGYIPQLALWTITGSGANVMNGAIPANLAYGAFPDWAYFERPLILQRNSTLTVQHQNLDGTNARNVWAVFRGFKISSLLEKTREQLGIVAN